MRNPLGWNYPAGLENDPNAPWNQIDDGEDEDEHESMLSCECSEADQLYGVCLFCGKVSLPDPSWVFIGAAVLLFLANIYLWWAM